MIDWIYAIWHWVIFLILLPLWIPLRFITGTLFGFDTHTKYYDHMFNFTSTTTKDICGYCGVVLNKTDIQFHAYNGQHLWWCFLKRARRNELIAHIPINNSQQV